MPGYKFHFPVHLSARPDNRGRRNRERANKSHRPTIKAIARTGEISSIYTNAGASISGGRLPLNRESRDRSSSSLYPRYFSLPFPFLPAARGEISLLTKEEITDARRVPINLQWNDERNAKAGDRVCRSCRSILIIGGTWKTLCEERRRAKSVHLTWHLKYCWFRLRENVLAYKRCVDHYFSISRIFRWIRRELLLSLDKIIYKRTLYF